MTSFVRRLAARLLEQERTGAPEPLTRNRHFEVFGDRQGRLALRVYRHLRSLQRDILASVEAPVVVEPGPEGEAGRVRLTIALPGRRGVRTAFLTADELELLLETPGIRDRLGDPGMGDPTASVG
jgi:hypothetical protein